MKPKDIKDRLRAVPFTPFAIHLDNGQALAVEHPDCMLMIGSSCVLAEQGHFRWFNLAHVSSLALAAERRRKARKTR